MNLNVIKIPFLSVCKHIIIFTLLSAFAHAIRDDVSIRLEEEFFMWSANFRRSYSSSKEYNTRLKIWLNHNGMFPILLLLHLFFLHY